MKRTIGALTIILGLAIAEPALAYPTADSPANANANANGEVMDSHAGTSQNGTTMNNTTGVRQTERVKMNKLPQQVQSTINDHSQNGQVKHIERATMNNGQTCYLVTLKTSDGNIQHFKVSADGQYQGQISTEKWNKQNGNTTSQDQNSGGLRSRQEER